MKVRAPLTRRAVCSNVVLYAPLQGMMMAAPVSSNLLQVSPGVAESAGAAAAAAALSRPLVRRGTPGLQMLEGFDGEMQQRAMRPLLDALIPLPNF